MSQSSHHAHYLSERGKRICISGIFWKNATDTFLEHLHHVTWSTKCGGLRRNECIFQNYYNTFIKHYRYGKYYTLLDCLFKKKPLLKQRHFDDSWQSCFSGNKLGKIENIHWHAVFRWFNARTEEKTGFFCHITSSTGNAGTWQLYFNNIIKILLMFCATPLKNGNPVQSLWWTSGAGDEK